MAVAVQTFESTGYASASATLVITKPTGLVIGDLMVAIISIAGETTVPSMTPPTGWATEIAMGETGSNNVGRAAYYKIAVSGDVAGSNFTFTAASSTTIAGGILRINGHDPNNPIFFSDDVEPTGVTTLSAATSVTPQMTNSLAVTAFFLEDARTLSSFTLTPTTSLTEAFQHDAASPDTTIGVAYGTYSTTTEITSYGATQSASSSAETGIILLLTPQTDASADVSELTFATGLNGFIGSNTANGDVSNLSIVPGLNSPTFKGQGTRWIDKTKTSTTWTSKDK